MTTTMTVHIGDCVESMRKMPTASVHTCVTSPPYFGLRDYGVDGQIGLEETPDEYVMRLVEVFREVWRVLRDDGTLWLNLGDSYATQGGSHAHRDDQKSVGANSVVVSGAVPNRNRKPPNNLKTKDLIGIPWRVAFALQADGWYLRQDIIWHKPNPMPESVRDRCTKSHEYIFLMTKNPRYYFDNESIREQGVYPAGTRAAKGGAKRFNKENVNSRPPKYAIYDGMRNKRSVWSVTTKPFKGAHFATFPPDLIEPCILAGCPKNGIVMDPFGGSGTTAGVAIKHGRNAIVCELNPEYASMMPLRVETITGKPLPRMPL